VVIFKTILSCLSLMYYFNIQFDFYYNNRLNDMAILKLFYDYYHFLLFLCKRDQPLPFTNIFPYTSMFLSQLLITNLILSVFLATYLFHKTLNALCIPCFCLFVRWFTSTDILSVQVWCKRGWDKNALNVTF
jgi:hypothetical protein